MSIYNLFCLMSFTFNNDIENGNFNIPKGKGIGANLNLEMIIKKGKIWEE